MTEEKIKGLKRYLAVDSDGFSLTIVTFSADVYDSRSMVELTINMACIYPAMRLLKADNDYRGPLIKWIECGIGVCEIEFRNVEIQTD